jgi:hypothetical protein
MRYTWSTCNGRLKTSDAGVAFVSGLSMDRKGRDARYHGHDFSMSCELFVRSKVGIRGRHVKG